jgi:hypothetical protein
MFSVSSSAASMSALHSVVPGRDDDRPADGLDDAIAFRRDEHATSFASPLPSESPEVLAAKRVFTIGFCGTGSGFNDAEVSVKYGKGELVSTLLKHTVGQDFVDKLTVDGPGSGNHQQATAFSDFTAHSHLTGTLAGAGMHQNARHAQNVLHGKATRLYGNENAVGGRLGALMTWAQDKWHALTGWGQSSLDIADARAKVASLEQLIAENRSGPITHINIVAFSRGSATAHIFANMLSRDVALSKIEVRMICIDPVAGIGNHSKDVMTIPKNVKEVVYYTAGNERAFIFETFKPTRNDIDETRTVFRQMAGKHGMLVGGLPEGIPFDVSLANSVTDAVRMRVATHLRKWGTEIHETLPGAVTAVPLKNATRLAALDKHIEDGQAGGAFDTLHKRSYLGKLTHSNVKVYATAKGYGLPSGALSSGKAQKNEAKRASLDLIEDEITQRWTGSVVDRVHAWGVSVFGGRPPTRVAVTAQSA